MVEQLKSPASVRGRLAFSVVSTGMAGIVIAAVSLLLISDDQSRPEMARLVFSSVLPLFGTWIGTVLAFYFARENLQAATDSTVELARARNPETAALRVMIVRSAIKCIEVSGPDEARATRLSTIADAMAIGSVKRMPILSNGVVNYVIHSSTLAAYADGVGEDVSHLAGTVRDIENDGTLGSLITAFGFIASDAVLADARRVMRSTNECNDVFMTASGDSQEPIIGWLTNTLLAGVE